MDYKELNLKTGDTLTAGHMAHIEKGIDDVTAEVANLKKAKIVLRNDNEANWELVADTVVLLKGEPAIEFDEENNAKLKIGDGINVWKDLPYFGSSSETILPEDLEERFQSLENMVSGFDIRIQNSESGVTAAVLASEEALAMVEELRAELAANTQEQNATIAAAQEQINESVAIVNAVAAEVEEIKNTQETQEMKIDTANARVDVLVAGFSDNANYDNAELLDIRAGYDGITYESAGAAVRQIGYDLNELSQNLVGALGKEIPDGLAYEGTKLYLTANGEQIGDAVTVIGGSGGGGSINQTYTMTLMNLLDSRAIVITKDDTCVLEFSYHSIDEDNFNDGPGIGYVFVNNSQVSTLAVPQGNNSFDITHYLSAGENNVKIQVENSEGSRKTLTYTVNVLVLSVTTTAPKMALYSGSVSLPYTVNGAGAKTVYFEMDGLKFYQENVATSGASRVVPIPEQLDGPHILSIYAEVANGPVEKIRSNVLEIGMLYHSSTTTTQAILMMNYEGAKEVEQGTTLTFPYMVYDPFLQSTDIVLNIYEENGDLYNTFPLQVDQSPKEWATQDYPAGNVRFEIACKDAIVSQTIVVKPTTFNKEIITDSCVLDFNARGRSNNETNPAHWEYNGITAEFDGFGWANIDGWFDNGSGQTALRFLPGNTMAINYKPFEEDCRVNGYTIEAEFETHNVRDYDSVIVDVMDEGRGLSIKSQWANLTSEQKGISIQFKEDSRVRIAFVVEPTSLYRLVYVYVNGVMSGVIQYPEGDDFQQISPTEILIGSESCGLDLYSLRMYNKGLTRHEQLNNYICDRPTLAERIKANDENNVLDENDQVSIANLPMHLPYMIIECEELPQYKGDKKKNKSVTYVEPLHPERSFTATGVQLDVQGTSSAGYPVKNYKVSLKSGLTYTSNGETASGFPIIAGGLEGKNICLKADFASSEHANNVCLVDFYEELAPYKSPAQLTDERVRLGVRGFPCVVFWRNTETNETIFVGTYNFNDDKSNENVFGFDRDVFPNCECVEFRNNVNPLVKFQSSDYEQMIKDEKGQMVKAWTDAFEFRFPDLDDPYSDYTQFKRMTDWVCSTWLGGVTNNDLEEPVTYKHWKTNLNTTFNTDSEDYRLSKFKSEFNNYFIKDAMTFYYLFTEVFLLVDNRAKNMFLTTFDGEHWFPIPYDMDTAIGINNEGSLSFEYDLEDYDPASYDTGDQSSVFNCGDSALWVNFYKVFKSDVDAMYATLRSGTKFNYNYINNKMRAHQTQWPIAIYNEDEYNKYIGSFIDKGEDYLEMLQGDKQSQRDWWLFNGFKYRDSKYFTADATSNFITLRLYSSGEISVTPYQHLHPRIKYGSAVAMYEEDEGRVKRNQTVVLPNPIADAEINDLETYIYSADRIASIGDLSSLKVGLANFAAATKLQQIILGSAAEGYQNPNLKNLTVGNNELLTLVNITNCNSEDFTSLDLSGCHGLEALLAEGTKLTGVNLPNGGHLKILKLPATIANLTIQNQKNIETLSLQSQDSLYTLRLEGTPNLPIETLINNSPKLDRVRLVNIEWTATSEEELRTTINKLKAARGLDANGLNLSKAVVTGRVHIQSISDSFLEEINDAFSELVVVVNGVAKYFIRYVDHDATLLYRYIATEGTAAINPVELGYIDEPVRENTDRAHFVYKGWSELPEDIRKPYSIIARYEGTYLINFYRHELDYSNNEIGSQQWIKEYEGAKEPVNAGYMTTPRKDSTASHSYKFVGWHPDYSYIDGSVYDFYPVFEAELRSYPVYFYNDSIKLQEGRVYYGDTAVFTGNDEEIYKYIGGEASPYYEFTGWSPDPSEPITGPTTFYAQFAFDGYIEDSWEQIIQACKNGDISKYGLGGRKKLNFTFKGVEMEAEMEIVGKNHDNLATIDESYNGGASTAALSFMMCVLNKPFTRVMNSSAPQWDNGSYNENGQLNAGYNNGGWAETAIRKELHEEFFSILPAELQTNIKLVKKLSDRGYYAQYLNETEDLVWIPSAAELNGEVVGEVVMGQGKPYPLFNLNTSRIKTDANGRALDYWTRSSGLGLSHFFSYVATSGYVYYNVGGAARLLTVAFGFCL